MMRPRWRKVLADLTGHFGRSLLVMVSIAVGLFAVGMTATGYANISVDMRTSYSAANPFNVYLAVYGFDQDLLDVVKRLDNVRQAEGVRTLNLRVRTGDNTWRPIGIKAIPEMDQQAINQVRMVSGTWPPADRQIIVEESKLSQANLSSAGELELELPSGIIRRLKLVGTANDQTIGAVGVGGGYFMAPIQGYVTYETLAWLEQPESLDSLYVTVAGDPTDLGYLGEVRNQIVQEVESAGYTVQNSSIRSSDDHPNRIYIDAMAGVLLMLSFLVLFLSTFLITNTLTALLNQQTQQIGIMKSLGARRGQIIAIYLALILVYGLLAFLIAMPLSGRASYELLSYMSLRINITPSPYQGVSLEAAGLQLLVALLVPFFAGLAPVLHGTRLTVLQATSGIEQENAAEANSRFDRWLHSIRRFSRPLLVSLRNTFRHKGRLALTLITLTLGGAIFIATFQVRESVNQFISRLGKYFLADINLALSRPYRSDEIKQVILQVPGVVDVEAWGFSRCELVLADGTTSDPVQLMAPPAGTKYVDPILLQGRWLAPADENAITINERFLSQFPALKPGDTLRLKVNGQETDWMIVGVFQFAGDSTGFMAYVNNEYLERLTNQAGRSNSYRVVTGDGLHTLEAQTAIAEVIDTHLKALGYEVAESRPGLSLTQNAGDGLNILTVFLLIMASLTALVGAIGLTGTMSLNVMERTREIGILRAIGAPDRAIMSMVIVEGWIIGGISWALGSLLAFPISQAMADVVSQALFNAPATFTYTPTGFVVWLGLALVLSTLASLLPARSAARLTIREVLAYE